MRNRTMLRAALTLGLAALAPALLPDAARAVTIRFAQEVAVTQNVTDSANLLGAPDALFGGFFGAGFAVPGDATLSDFSNEQTYSTSGLAALLGVSEAVLENADAITVELEGLPAPTTNDSYETTTHTFDDGVGSRTVSNVYIGAFDAEIVARPSISTAAYDAFFGTSSPVPPAGVYQYAFLLFDLDAAAGAAVDLLAPGFSWRVLGDDLNLGSPDPDFFGVIVHESVPEPGSLALLALGFALVVGARRR